MLCTSPALSPVISASPVLSTGDEQSTELQFVTVEEVCYTERAGTGADGTEVFSC